MAETPMGPNATSIEALFRPTTRFRDSHRNRDARLPESYTEVELRLKMFWRRV
jgi:hypothetical protein